MKNNSAMETLRWTHHPHEGSTSHTRGSNMDNEVRRLGLVPTLLLSARGPLASLRPVFAPDDDIRPTSEGSC